jgi:hypothetical protein
MKKKLKIEICQYIPATSIVPRKWDKWFWETISNNAPFSWGDNNRSLVTAECLVDHFESCDLPSNIKDKEIIEFQKTCRELGQMYIDLEN